MYVVMKPSLHCVFCLSVFAEMIKVRLLEVVSQPDVCGHEAFTPLCFLFVDIY